MASLLFRLVIPSRPWRQTQPGSAGFSLPVVLSQVMRPSRGIVSLASAGVSPTRHSFDNDDRRTGSLLDSIRVPDQLGNLYCDTSM